MDPEDPAFHQPAWAVRQFNPYPDVYGKRPSFGQWLKQTWPDIVTMIFTGAVGLIVFHLPPAPSRSIAVTYANGQIVYPEFAYPQRQVIVPIWLATFLASGIPIAAILLAQIRIRSFWDANNGITGLLYGLVTAATLQALVKWLIGGLRPHFLDVCQPDPDILEGASGSGYGNLYYTSEICTGDAWDVRDSVESFPSGHSTAAFAGFVYLSLYLNAKLKVFSDSHPAMWKLILLWVPILGAILIGGSLTIDASHNWYDVLAGAILGTLMAFSAYRTVYASIWDWRFNHIPLRRGELFKYETGKGSAVRPSPNGGFTSEDQPYTDSPGLPTIREEV